jgi:uncharacterized protein YjdB
MNLIGIAQEIVKNITMVAGLNDPQYKITPVGALKAVLENNAVSEITNLAGLQKGLDRTIKVRAVKRGLESDVVDVDNCETTISPVFYEHEITKTLYHKIGIYISDSDMRTFEEQAAAGFQVGGVTMPSILAEMVFTKVNGLIQKIDRAILTAIETGKGVNAVTGSDAAQTVNFASSLTDDDGYVKLLTDAETNEVNGDLIIIGSGVIRNFDMLNKMKVAADNNGFGAIDYKVYNDPKAASVWGANEFFTVQKGSIGMADWQKFGGTFGGMKGTSMFFTIPVPVQLANGELSSLVFDAQLQYKDCPIYDESDQLVADRGWVLLLSKSFGVYTAPKTMFAAGDPLENVNGIFHYIGAKEETVYQVNQTPTKIDVTGITTDDVAETIAVGATWDFASHLTVAPADASVKWVLYSSATPAKATVSQAGVVTGVAAGTSVITATTVDGNYSVTATVTVTA